jgi:hypothetical protein
MAARVLTGGEISQAPIDQTEQAPKLFMRRALVRSRLNRSRREFFADDIFRAPTFRFFILCRAMLFCLLKP